MANTKISALTSASTPLTGTEVLPIVQSGATVKVAVSNLTAGRSISVSGLTNTGLTASKPVFTDGSNLLTSSGTVPTTQGGTGLTSFTTGGLLYASSSSALSTSGPVYSNSFIGVNVAPAAWYTSFYSGYQMSLAGALYFDSYYENTNLSTNSYGYAADAYKGLRTGWALRYVQTNGGAHVWLTSTVVVDAGTVISYNQPMTLTNAGYLLVGYTSSNGAYKLQVNSQIFATSSTIATSDGRYKENVQPLTNALDMVNALNPVSFNWKKHPVHEFDTQNKTVGFIAQEVKSAWADQPFVDSIVKKNDCVLEPEERAKDGTLIKAAVTEEFLGIAEGNIVAILTKAIQELSAKVAALENKGI
jgi:hypothetical protein